MSNSGNEAIKSRGHAAAVADRLSEHLLKGREDEARATFRRLAAWFEEEES